MPSTIRTVCALILAASTLPAQEPVAATFDANARLVLVPFNVQRGKFYAADLQRSDFLLREDGRPRDFTTFEGPNTPDPLPLELILLFDTTPRSQEKNENVRRYQELFSVDPKADYKFLSTWDEKTTRELLQRNGMDIRLSVYHFAANQLERLCSATSDPAVILSAFHSLLKPIPAGSGELTVLPGDKIPDAKAPAANLTGWVNESVVAAMRDAVASPVQARRLLLVFTAWGSGTQASAGANPISGPALSMSIPVDTVVMEMDNQERHVSGYGVGIQGLASADAPKSAEQGGQSWTKGYLPQISKEGDQTGGQTFVPHTLDRDALVDILSVARDTALSQYAVGFVPNTVAAPKKHNLSVALASRSKGKIIGGEKEGVIY